MMGAESAAQHEGANYLKAAAIGMPLWSMIYAGNASQQGAGDTRTPMVIGVIINVVNIIVAYLLINGPGPFPRMEVVGSGAGFTSASIVGFVVVALVLGTGMRTLRWTPLHSPPFEPAEARRMLNVGMPAGAEQFQFNIAFMVYTRIIADLGTAALAAHGITLALQSLTFNVGFALSVATMTLVGQSLGAGRPDLAEKAAYLTMRYALGFMICLGLIMMVFGGTITDLFVGGEGADEVVHIGRQLLFIFGLAMPGMAVSLALGGALRGAGDTRAVLAIMAGSTWVVRLVPAYMLAIVFGLGVPGAWAAAVMDISMRAVLMFLRFRQGGWKRITV
jgi:putative MATE family efflux protein